jgi:dipeptidyl aminopeptidase/acylaminoacyl peptidase
MINPRRPRIARSWPIAVLLAGWSTLALGQERGLTAEKAAAMRSLGGVQLSPDGRWVAYSVAVPDLKQSTTNSDIWLVAAGGGEPIRLTNSPAMDDQPRWSPDGRWIAFLSAREGGKPQLFRISPFGGEATRLTESKTPVVGFAWAPDGGRIAYVAQRDPTPEEEKKQKEKDDPIVVDQNFVAGRLWIHDLRTGKATELVKGEFQIQDPQWSPNGREIAFVTAPTPKADDGRFTDILIADASTGATRKLVENPGPDVAPRWSPDGAAIAFLTKGPKNAGVLQSKLAVVSPNGGAPRMLAPEFLYGPGPVAWSPDGQTLYFWTTVRTRNELFALPSSGGEPKQVSDLRGSLGFFGGASPSISSDGRTIAFPRSDIEHPEEVHLALLGGPWSHRALTRLNPELDGIPMGRGEVVRWKSTDGMEIEGIVVYPVGYDPAKRYPMVVQVHGGPAGAWPEAFGANWYMNPQVYAGGGWVTFLPNPRGSSGRGDAFLTANFNDWGGGDYRDIQSGIDFLIRKGVADSTRLAQTGWSYGGYMTAWTLTQTNRFKAVMVGAGLTNMYSMYSTNDLQTLLEEYFGAEPWDNEQAYRRASAMMFIKQARTPTLILHGQQDIRVPIGQAQELYMGPRKNDVPATLVFYPREGHGLTEPRHALDKMKREYAFFSKHVLGIEVKDQPELVP